MICTFEGGCHRLARRNMLCHAHSEQLRQGFDLTPILPPGGAHRSKDHVGEICNGRSVLARGPDLIVEANRQWKRGKRKDHTVVAVTRRWLVECLSCGRQTILTWQQVRTRSCKRCRAEASRKDDVHVVSTKVFYLLRTGALARGYSCAITLEDVARLMVLPCHYCGIDGGNLDARRFRSFKYNGIDRVDNKRGYEQDNIVPCCWNCNRAKGSMTYHGFVEWLKRVSSFWRDK